MHSGNVQPLGTRLTHVCSYHNDKGRMNLGQQAGKITVFENHWHDVCILPRTVASSLEPYEILMKPHSPHPGRIARYAQFLCVASAILVTGFLIDGLTHLQSTSRLYGQIGSELAPATFAHSVQLQHREYAPFDRIRSNVNAPQSLTTVPDWYRSALPLATAVLLLAFSVWALQTQPNDAVFALEHPLPLRD